MLSNPIALAVTVSENFYSDFKPQLQYAGPFLLYNANAKRDSIDLPGIGNSIAGIRIDDFKGPWVSSRDYSPIRIIYTKRLAANITHMTLEYAKALINEDRYDRANKILDWAEEYENATELGPGSSEQISELRKIIYRGND